MKKTVSHLILLLLVVLIAACSSQNGKTASNGEPMHEARLLNIEHAKSFTHVVIKNPWDTTSILHSYVLVHRDSIVPDSLPQGDLVRVPLQNAVVYSAVHTGAMAELGATDAIKGVTDAQYFNDTVVAPRLARGIVTDCGSSMSPTIEKIIELHADAIVLSPYQDMNFGALPTTGTPIIECADYMEYTPLGRAEWIKLFGELLCRREQADSIYNRVVRDYNTIVNRIAQTSARPTVLTELPMSGVWNVPGGNSYMARMLADAGALYMWADDQSTGSLSLDVDQVLAKAQKANVWLIKSNAKTYSDVKASGALIDKFDAWRNRHIYVCDTQSTTLFNDFPFHPELLLADFAGIFHPEIDRNHVMRYYKLLEQ